MTCRNCGAEIADKALICYRCGSATTEAKYKPAAVRAKSSKRGPMLTIIVLVIALLLLLAYFYFRGASMPAAQAWPHDTMDAHVVARRLPTNVGLPQGEGFRRDRMR